MQGSFQFPRGIGAHMRKGYNRVVVTGSLTLGGRERKHWGMGLMPLWDLFKESERRLEGDITNGRVGAGKVERGR